MSSDGENRGPWWRRLWGKGDGQERGRAGGRAAPAPPPPRLPVRADGLMTREIARRERGVETSESAALRLTRFIGTPGLDVVDPFILLESIRALPGSAKLADFAELPMLGFDAVTYLVAGRMQHWDNQGFSGTIPAGGVQWLTASGGLVRGERPEREDGSFLGFRIWLNLPSGAKRADAAYAEFGTDRLPVEQRLGARLKVITGETSEGLVGPILNRSGEPLLMDIALEPGAMLEEEVARSRNLVLLVYEGEIGLPSDDEEVGTQVLASGEFAVMGEGDVVTMIAGAGGARVLFLSALPHGEPVFRSGPFAMASHDELLKVLREYRQGKI